MKRHGKNAAKMVWGRFEAMWLSPLHLRTREVPAVGLFLQKGPSAVGCPRWAGRGLGNGGLCG